MEGLERTLGDLFWLRESKLGNKGDDREARPHFHWDRNTMSLWIICKEMILKLCFHIRLCKEVEQNKGKKEGGWETTRCRTPTQSWIVNEKDPPKHALRKWSKCPKTAERIFAKKSQGKNNRDVVNCFPS